MKICFACEQYDDTLHEHPNGLLICADCEKTLDGNGDRRQGTCPNCNDEGPLKVGCPQCPGFWFKA